MRGDVAQMVERSLSMWEVGGSIPPVSNFFSLQFFFLRVSNCPTGKSCEGKKDAEKKLLHRPGIEPGPPAWQASILPLNQRCSDVTQGIIVQSVWASLNVRCLINVSATAWMPQMWKMKRQSTQFGCHKCGKWKKVFCSWQNSNLRSQKKTEAMFWKYSGSTEIWTRIAGFRVLSANHYTMEPCLLLFTFHRCLYTQLFSKSKMGSSGIWTRDLSHPKRESYP